MKYRDTVNRDTIKYNQSQEENTINHREVYIISHHPENSTYSFGRNKHIQLPLGFKSIGMVSKGNVLIHDRSLN